MTTETKILSQSYIRDIAMSAGCNPDLDDGALVARLIAITEQAVLQSQEIQGLYQQLAESRANDRTAMGYLADVREIVGGDDFPNMVRRVVAMQQALEVALVGLERICAEDRVGNCEPIAMEALSDIRTIRAAMEVKP